MPRPQGRKHRPHPLQSFAESLRTDQLRLRDSAARENCETMNRCLSASRFHAPIQWQTPQAKRSKRECWTGGRGINHDSRIASNRSLSLNLQRHDLVHSGSERSQFAMSLCLRRCHDPAFWQCWAMLVCELSQSRRRIHLREEAALHRRCHLTIRSPISSRASEAKGRIGWNRVLLPGAGMFQQVEPAPPPRILADAPCLREKERAEGTLPGQDGVPKGGLMLAQAGAFFFVTSYLSTGPTPHSLRPRRFG